MKVENINGRDYRLPGGLNEFQLQMYVHLIDWKRAHITAEPGNYEYRGRQIPYDAILPEEMIEELRVIYPPVVEALRRHRRKNRFRLHSHFNHMASSQAARMCNSYCPFSCSIRWGNKVLALLQPDFASLATDHLDHGYCLEFWAATFIATTPTLGFFVTRLTLEGTDSDVAIAYRNHAGEPARG